MPRPRTGSVFEHRLPDGSKHWDVQLTLPNGKRSPRIHLEPGTSEAMAREHARAWSEQAARGELVLDVPIVEPPAGETLTAWSSRWFDARGARGLDVDTDRGRFRKWVTAPAILEAGGTLGARPFVALTRSDLEVLVEWLDAQVTAGALAWKSAVNVWGLVTKACADAVNAKDRALRVRTDNPAIGVRGPDRGAEKAKAWLHPREVARLLSAIDEPLELRRALALSVYLYPRPGELRALTWADVDLETHRVSIHRTEKRDGSFKATKTKATRRVPIEPALLPMLATMRAESAGEGRVAPGLPSDIVLAETLRAMLQRAGVDRAELFSSDRTRRAIRWYDLRATGITWRAIRGDEPLRIMQAAGHERFETTLLYIREAETVGGDFGAVFAPIEPELFERAPGAGDAMPRGESLPRIAPAGRKYRETEWVDRDSNRGEGADSRDSSGDSRPVDPATIDAKGPKSAEAGRPVRFGSDSEAPPRELLEVAQGLAGLASWDVLEAEILRLDGLAAGGLS